MIPLRQLLRLLYINRVLVRHGLDELVFTLHLFRPFRFVQYMLPWRWFKSDKKDRPRGERIRCALEDLGPIFVKFGQMLSTRPDLLPPDIAQELAMLQDKVPPFPGELSRQIIEKNFSQPIDEVFESFEDKPLASASIAQVHVATLKDGKEVIVKVVRPNIEKTIGRDIALLYVMAELAHKYWSEGKRLRPVEVVSEYEKTIYDELDMQREAASATQLRRNFSKSELLYIPEVYWDYTREQVLVMERIHGIPVSNIKRLVENNIDLEKLSEQGVEIFFTQVFKHNFFHADMHPGNIFVSPEGQYIAIDFGIVGSLNPADQRYLADNFLAFFNRDYRRVAELHVESGWVPGDTRIDEFEAAIRSVCEPIFEKPLREISFGQVLLRLFQTARRFEMEIQPQLVLLQKTLLNIEGLGRELNPNLDLWKTAKPFLERWMHEQIGFRALLKNIGIKAPMWIEKLPEMPGLVHQSLEQMNRFHQQQMLRDKETRQLRQEVRGISQKVFLLLLAVALVVGASLFSLNTRLLELSLEEVPLISWLMGSAAIVIFLYAWPRGNKI